MSGHGVQITLLAWGGFDYFAQVVLCNGREGYQRGNQLHIGHDCWCDVDGNARPNALDLGDEEFAEFLYHLQTTRV